MNKNWSSLKKLIWFKGNPGTGGGSEVELTVTGQSPLSLPNAKAKPMLNLIQYGKCELSGTPTPSNPVDLTINIGKFVQVDNDLPSEYRRVKGLKFNNNCYFQIEDFRLTGADTVRFSLVVRGACNVFGSYTTAQATDNYSLYTSNSSTAKYMRYNGGAYASGILTAEYGTQYDVEITPTGSSGLPRNDTWSEQEFECSTDMCIGTTSPSATSSKLVGDLIGVFEVVDRFYGIPCERLEDNVLGYYDYYSSTFYEPTVGTPVSMGYDGSQSYTTADVGYSRIAVGNQSVEFYDYLYGVGDLKDEYDVVAGTWQMNCDMCTCSGDYDYWEAISGTNCFRWQWEGAANENAALVCTHFAGTTAGIASMADGTIQLVEDVGIVVRYDAANGDADTFMAWIIAQRDAGTPVLIVYPRSSPYQGTITQHTITLAEGSNTVTADTALSSVELKAVYKAVVQSE